MLIIPGHKGNANQSHTKIPPHTARIATIKNTTSNKCWQGCGKKEPSHTVGGNISYCNHSGKQYGGFLKNYA
jgi:hypothetical protein